MASFSGIQATSNGERGDSSPMRKTRLHPKSLFVDPL
jgi:hypothetical protein